MALPLDKVVNCGVRWNERTARYRAHITKQVTFGGATKYERHADFFGTWAEVVAWFATF